MNCDQTFDLMTDLSCDDRTALHEHLSVCPRCRDMYETLSPALGMFENASDGNPGGDLDSAACSAVEVAERVALRLSHSPRPARSRTGHDRRFHTSVAVGLLGLAILFGATALLLPPARSTPQFNEGCTWRNRDATPQTLRASAVVQTCVACHRELPAETTQTDSLKTKFTGFKRADLLSQLPMCDPQNPSGLWVDADVDWLVCLFQTSC